MGVRRTTGPGRCQRPARGIGFGVFWLTVFLVEIREEHMGVAVADLFQEPETCPTCPEGAWEVAEGVEEEDVDCAAEEEGEDCSAEGPAEVRGC